MVFLLMHLLQINQPHHGGIYTCTEQQKLRVLNFTFKKRVLYIQLVLILVASFGNQTILNEITLFQS